MRSTWVLLFLFLLAIVSFGQEKPPSESALDRFLRYAKIDTQSAEDKDVVPSTQKQFDLARLLEKELKALGRFALMRFCQVKPTSESKVQS